LNYGLYTQNKNLIDTLLDDVKGLYITVTRNGISHLTLVKHGFHNFIFIDNYGRISELIGRDRIQIIFTSSFWYEQNHHTFKKPLYKLKSVDLSASDVGLYFALNKNTAPEIVTKIENSFNEVL